MVYQKLHKLIVMSATYRQASEARPDTYKADPDNRLWGRMNRQRLEAEAIRDNLLSASGRLEPAMGGVGYRDFSTPRRTLYYMTIRSDRDGFRAAVRRSRLDGQRGEAHDFHRSAPIAVPA